MSLTERIDRKLPAENPTYLEIKRGLQRAEESLASQGASCAVEGLGVFHDFRPSAALHRKVGQADIITLELTRNVVHAGLAGGESQLLANNIFWRETIEVLRTHSEGKLIRGIEVNQTARVGWKRFSLHHSHNTLGSALFTVEAQEGLPEEIISLFLQPEQIVALRKYGWLMVEGHCLCSLIDGLAMDAANKPGYARTWPVVLTPGLNLVAARVHERKIPNYLVTFMLPPHSSLEEARQAVEEEIGNFAFALAPREMSLLSIMVMENILLSPSELTDAREIVYVLNQFVRRGVSWPTIRCLHIGGIGHLSVISNIFQECLPSDSQRIKICQSSDPRFGLYRGDIRSFLREKVPSRSLVDIVDVKGFEVYANPQKAAKAVRTAIDGDRDDFWKRILIWRILKGRYTGKETKRALIQELRDQDELYGKDLEELGRIASATSAN